MLHCPTRDTWHKSWASEQLPPKPHRPGQGSCWQEGPNCGDTSNSWDGLFRPSGSGREAPREEIGALGGAHLQESLG